MFYFVNFSGDSSSQSYDQGILFEKIVKKIVDRLGYKVTNWREKISGKEYDIHAIAKIGGRQLIGEAKARRENQTIPVIAAFSGSLDNVNLPQDVLGLFISISNLSSDAKDWLNNNRKKDQIVTIVGDEILDRLVEIGYSTTQQIKNFAESQFDMRTGDTHLLISDRGDYFIQTLARRDESRIKAFCIFDETGTRIEDNEFGDLIKKRVEDFQELKYLSRPQKFQTHLDDTQGLISIDKEGAGWFEHKLPAHPDCFVGRLEQIRDFKEFINDVANGKTNIRVYQILSPSGVGKSSFLLKIYNEAKEIIKLAIFQDARNFRSSIDILNLYQEFLDKSFSEFKINQQIPTDKQDVMSELKRIDVELRKQNSVGVIFIDQFESLFTRPDLYNDLLDFILEIIVSCKNIVICIARKNDQPTTFDEKEVINLQRLRQISKSIELKDFSAKEAIELISHLDEEIKQPLKIKLRDMILEFSASGFPWLIKRITAHVRDMITKNNMSQDELIQNGVRPDELFQEDLSELDIADREFLKEIAHYLPATIDELSQIEKFKGKLLSVKISTFQNQRLIRLIGRTYDTYNDVFKHYLKYGEILQPNKYAYRVSPVTTFFVLNKILEMKPPTTDEIQSITNLDFGTVHNALRELRMLELINYKRGILKIDEETISSYEKGELDLRIKDQVWKNNGLVQDIVNRLSTEGELELKELIGFMKTSLPLLDLSDNTWDIYARTLVSWLRYVGLIKPGMITSEGRAIGATRRGGKAKYFLPSSYVNQIISLMNQFGRNEEINICDLENVRWAKIDCIKLGLIREDRSGILSITEDGKNFIENEISRPKYFKNCILKFEYKRVYFEQIKGKMKNHVEVLKNTLGNTAFTEETWLWRSKVLVNWLVFACLVQRKNGKIVIENQMEFFQ